MNYPPFDGSQECLDDPELFFPNEHPITKADRALAAEDIAAAKVICNSCVFMGDCAEYALRHEVVGVWGGLSTRDRQKLRIRRDMPKPSPVIADDQQIRRDNVLAMAGIFPTKEIAQRTGLAQSTVQSIIRDRRLKIEARRAVS